jgi:hypothetical protein
MSNIDRYTKFIAEQVRKGTITGLRSQPVNEATEKTAVKHALKDLHSRLGGNVEGPQRTGRGTQMTSPKIDTSHHSKEKVAKALTSAGYKKTESGKKLYLTGTSYDSYEKSDAHGYKHYVNHLHDRDGRHSVHHVGASNSRRVNEAKDPHKDMEDEGYSHFHSTPEGHHIYAHEDTDRGESLHYAVKHPDGKVTHHSIEHGGEPVTSKQLHGKHEWHSVGKADIPHEGVRKVIHKDIKDELSNY